MSVRYWDYWDQTGPTSSTTTGTYYKTWTVTTSASTATTVYYRPPVRIERFIITGFDDWSDEARATLTRLINDETNVGFKIEMWIIGDIDITDMGIQLRDLDWLMLRLRQIASASDYEKIAACVAAAREEAKATQ